MTDVIEIMENIEEKSNEIDIIATIKNCEENFKSLPLESLSYPIKDNMYIPRNSIQDLLKDNPNLDKSNITEEMIIKNINESLEQEGIFIQMAIANIWDEEVSILSIKNVSFPVEDLINEDNESTLVEENLDEEEEDEDYYDEEEFNYYDYIYDCEGTLFGLKIKNDNGINQVGFYIEEGGPTCFHEPTIQEIESSGENLYRDISNPIIQEVIKAIDNCIIYKK